MWFGAKLHRLLGAEFRRLLRIEPAGRLRTQANEAVLGVLDQGVTALGGVVPVILLGRLAGANDLALFALATSIGLFFMMALDTMFLSSYPVFRAAQRSNSRAISFYVLLFGACAQLLFVPLYLAGLWWCSASLHSHSICPAMALVPLLPTIVLRQYLRTISLYRGEVRRVLVLDLWVVGAQCLCLGLLALIGKVDIRSAFLVLSLASVAFIAAWLRQNRAELEPTIDGLRAYLARALRFGAWAFGGVGASSVHYYLAPWVVFTFRGAEETAVFAAASTVVGLVNHAFLGLTKGLEARAADAYFRGGAADLHRTLLQTMGLVGSSLILLGVALALGAELLAGLILPDQTQRAAIVVQLLTLAVLIGSVRVIFGNGLWAMGHPRATFSADFVRGAAGAVLVVIGAYHAGAAGCAAAFAVADIAGSGLLVMTYKRMMLDRSTARRLQ